MLCLCCMPSGRTCTPSPCTTTSVISLDSSVRWCQMFSTLRGSNGASSHSARQWCLNRISLWKKPKTCRPLRRRGSRVSAELTNRWLCAVGGTLQGFEYCHVNFHVLTKNTKESEVWRLIWKSITGMQKVCEMVCSCCRRADATETCPQMP